METQNVFFFFFTLLRHCRHPLSKNKVDTIQKCRYQSFIVRPLGILYSFIIFQPTGCKSSPSPTQQHAPAPLKSSLPFQPALCTHVPSTVTSWLQTVPLFPILSMPHPVPKNRGVELPPDLKRHGLTFFKISPLLLTRAAHVRGHYYSVQTHSSLSQLRKYSVTTWKRMKYL